MQSSSPHGKLEDSEQSSLGSQTDVLCLVNFQPDWSHGTGPSCSKAERRYPPDKSLSRGKAFGKPIALSSG